MGWADKYIEILKSGKSVQFRPKGNSMVPRIHSGEKVTVVPLDYLPYVDHIVLCTVKGHQYLHKIKAIKYTKTIQFLICNNKGHENGWISSNNIYGVVIAVEK